MSAFESTGIDAPRGLDVGLCGDGRPGADRHRHGAGRAPSPNNPARAEAATRSGERLRARARVPRSARFSEFLARKDAWAALAFVVLFKFTDAFSGTMTAPFVIDLGFTRNDYAAIVKGVGLAATLIGGFAGGYRGAALFAGRKPVDRRRAAGDRQPGRSRGSLLSASTNGRWRSPSRRRISPAPSAP